MQYRTERLTLMRLDGALIMGTTRPLGLKDALSAFEKFLGLKVS